MNVEEDILIERFLKDELFEVEKNKVLERIKSDVFFKEKVFFEKQLFETLNDEYWSFAEKIDLNEVREFENIFKGDEAKKIKESISIAQKEFKSKKKYNIKFVYFAAASITILFTAYSLFFTVNSTPNELYTAFIQKNELYSNISRGEKNLNNDLISAEDYFRNKNYSKALPIFIKELSNDKNSAQLYLYTAISQLELNEIDAAVVTLNNLIKSDLIDGQKGYWYKSLLFVKTNQLNKAKLQLEFIVKNSYFKHKEAKELLSKLKN